MIQFKEKDELESTVVNMYDPDQLRDAILTLSDRTGYTLTAISNRAGFSPSTLTRFINGTKGAAAQSLSSAKTKQLADAFPELIKILNLPSPTKTRTVNLQGSIHHVDVVTLPIGSVSQIEVPAGMLKEGDQVFGLLATAHSQGHFGHWVFIVDAEPVSFENAINSLICLVDNKTARMHFGYCVAQIPGKMSEHSKFTHPHSVKLTVLTRLKEPKEFTIEDPSHYSCHPVLMGLNPLAIRANQLEGYEPETDE